MTTPESVADGLRAGRASRLERVLPIVLVGMAVVLYAIWIYMVLDPGHGTADRLFGDFRTNVWSPGREVLAGRVPFREYTDDGIAGSVYPPAAFVSTLPFALPPFAVAAALWTVVQAGAVVSALLVCGVRDWRCVALALASPPVVVGLVYGNVSLVVTLCVALIWVSRDRPARTGVLLGVVIAARIFLAPLVVWLLLTGRRRSAGWTIATSVAASLVGWAAVGFRHIGDFPHITADNVSAFADQGESLSAVVANAGASPQAISAAGLVACLLALGFAWRHRTSELACFTWALCAALLLSPIVWVHYYALLLVPIACASPSLSTAWLLPYVSVLQMTAWAGTAMRVVSASTGVLLTLAVGRLSLRPMPAAAAATDASTRGPVQGRTGPMSSTDAVASRTG